MSTLHAGSSLPYKDGNTCSLNTNYTDKADYLKKLLIQNNFVISPEQVEIVLSQFKISIEDLLIDLVPIVKTYARPLLSNYYVGVAGVGQSGAIYAGVNLEFMHRPLNETIHAEQFLVTNALQHNEESLRMIALSAAPCGYCRQFLYETNHGSNIIILIPEQPKQQLHNLLPNAFGPLELGVKTGALLVKQNNQITINVDSSHADLELYLQAFRAANESYAPYTKCYSGIALRLGDNTLISGSYAENVAFNPSLSPLQSALIGLVAKGYNYSDIKSVLLVERKDATTSQINSTKDLLVGIANEASFDFILF